MKQVNGKIEEIYIYILYPNSLSDKHCTPDNNKPVREVQMVDAFVLQLNLLFGVIVPR